MWKKAILAAALLAGGMVSGFAAYESGTNPSGDENVQLCPIGENGERGDCYDPRNDQDSSHYRDGRRHGSYCNGPCGR